MKFRYTVLLLFIFQAAFSQTDSTFRMSVKDAVGYALQHHANVLNAQLDADIARYQVKEVVGMGLPQISASFDVKDYEKIPVQLVPAEFFGGNEGEFAAVQFGTRWNATAGLSASQLIFDPSYLVGVQASQAFRDLSRKNLDRTKIETAIEVTRAYYLVLLMKQRMSVVDANVARLDRLYRDTKAMYDNGFVEKIDADRILVALNNVKAEQEKFVRLIEISERSLRFQMGLPEGVNIELTDSLNAEDVKQSGDRQFSVDPAARIEYSILQTQKQVQKYNIKRYKGQYLPSLVAYGNLSAMAQRTEFDIFKTGEPWYQVGIIGATLNLNIFNGLQREYKIKQEKLSLRKIENSIRHFDSAVRLEATSANANLKDAVTSLGIQQENLELATDIARISKTKYDEGVGSNLEVLDAETSLKEAQTNYFNALYNAIVAKIDLDKALGTFTY